MRTTVKSGKNSDTSDTSRSAGQENPWYPRHESDRADRLVDELDEEQMWRLYSELKTRTYREWTGWLLKHREEICAYDSLSPAERKRRLRDSADIDALVFHHACLFVELWRARINREHFCLPPSGPDLDTPEKHRDMMLNVMAAFHEMTDDDAWPFDHPDIEDSFPFREGS